MTPAQQFLRVQAPAYIAQIHPGLERLWGKMSVQHMVEHCAGIFVLSTKPGHDLAPFIPPEYVTKRLDWLRSDKPFRENTKAPILPDEPLPLRFANLEEAKEKFLQGMDRFFAFYTASPDQLVVHPVFGPLGVEDWEQFHYKHLQHHFRQFGLLPRLTSPT